MSESFVLGDPDGDRWVVHPPQDSYGDDYIYSVGSELHLDGLTAATIAQIDGIFAERAVLLSGFVEGLAAGWRGWDGVRTWQSMGRELIIDARHDGRGYVSLGVTLRAADAYPEETAWSARAVFILEAGEEMTRLAADLSHLCSLSP
ncbi:DUF6228 family protein [Actinoplanes sp. NPDC051494]|uniref:DUF6228 family protein n=1 Tax=Actinoplanes sp. NPDC051494 TaxID=3363907 RepID=UPI0037971880